VFKEMKGIKLVRELCLLLTASISLFLFSACDTTASGKPALPPAAAQHQGVISDEIQPGETLTVELMDVGNEPGKVFQQTVREDGTITLLLNQNIKAAGLKKGELEEAIRNLYVPRYYKRMTVNVRREQLVFFVAGEVKRPDRYPYTAGLTVTKAISAAGDFTDYGKHTNVQVVRTNGKSETVNVKKALNGHPELDLPIYPGDTVVVKRRIF